MMTMDTSTSTIRIQTPEDTTKRPTMQQNNYNMDQLLEIFNNNQCMIVVGESGSRKKNQIHQWCAEWAVNQAKVSGKPGIVACTQPKRKSAICAATKVAEEMCVHLGEEVGYAIRFEDRTSEKTILKFCTDGLLVREIVNNPLLEEYSVIILDEAQQRSLNTDILMALAKKIMLQRSHIKIVLFSAQAEAENFRKYFDNCPILDVTSKKQIPEILRTNILSNVVLLLKKMGVEDFTNFGFMDQPDPENVQKAVENLKSLGALSVDEKLTELGGLMTEFPLDVNQSKMLLTSTELNCSNEILSIIAMLSVPDCFDKSDTLKDRVAKVKARFSNPEDSRLTFLNVYEAYKQNDEDPKWCLQNYVNYKIMEMADSVRHHLAKIMEKFNLKTVSMDSGSEDYYVNIKKALEAGDHSERC